MIDKISIKQEHNALSPTCFYNDTVRIQSQSDFRFNDCDTVTIVRKRLSPVNGLIRFFRHAIEIYISY